LLPPAKATFSNLHSYHTHFDLPYHQHNHHCSNSTTKQQQQQQRLGETKKGGVGEVQGESIGVTDALHCLQEAGDVIFVPTGWAHAILNMKETVGIASEFRYTFNHFA
jgi:hypothetical protein